MDYIHNYTDAYVTRDARRMSSSFLTGPKLDLMMTRQMKNFFTL